jgi:RNA polymerase sigma-70 factor (ECF subfamily)
VGRRRIKATRTRSEAPEKVLQELFLVSRARFVRVAYGVLKNEDDAEDAVQDAFLSAFRNLGDFEGRSTLTTWLTRIVINAALIVRRKRKPPSLCSLSEYDREDSVFVETIPGVQSNPESAYSQAESFKIIDALLGKMKPLLREALMMSYYQELSVGEASSCLGVPLSTFKARLSRGRRLLQQSAEGVPACGTSP